MQHIGDARLEIEEARSEPVLVKHEPGPMLPARRVRERAAWIVAAVLAVALVGTLAVPYLRPPAGAPEMRVELTTPATADPFSFALSPDGRNIVFVASGAGQSRLWLRPLDQTTAGPLPGTENARFPFWSPDGRSVGFFADAQLKLIEISGGVPRALASAPPGAGGT